MKLKLNGFGSLLAVLLAVANLGGLFYLTMEIITKGAYRGSTPGSFSMAEAAYLGALWTEIVAKACAGILLNVVVFGWILLNLKLDDQENELFRARVVAGMGTLKDQGRKDEAPVAKEPVRSPPAPERVPMEPLKAI